MNVLKKIISYIAYMKGRCKREQSCRHNLRRIARVRVGTRAW